jgi:hypothetical protein
MHDVVNGFIEGILDGKYEALIERLKRIVHRPGSDVQDPGNRVPNERLITDASLFIECGILPGAGTLGHQIDSIHA